MACQWHCMSVCQVRTSSRLGVRMAYCITAWIRSQRFLGNRKCLKRQIISWNPSIPSPRPSTCRKYTCTRRRWIAQVRNHNLRGGFPEAGRSFFPLLRCGLMTSLLLGFRDGYPYPHAHTLYFMEETDFRCRLRPEQFRAKMLMFTFGNALARAHKLYGVRICTSHLRGSHWKSVNIGASFLSVFTSYIMCVCVYIRPSPRVY